MKLRILHIFAVVLLFSSISSYGQRWKLSRYELVFGGGTAHYFGDIGGTADKNNLFGLKDIRIKEARPSTYIGVRYKYKKNIQAKFNLIYGYLQSTDFDGRNEIRGMSFTSNIIETSLQTEYYFIPEYRRIKSAQLLMSRRGQMNNFFSLSAYVFGGFGSVNYIPNLSGDLTNRTPSQYSGYRKMALTFPFGLGAKYTIDNRWSLGAELGARYTTTDYLEGFSPLASQFNDIYYFVSLVGIYKIKNDRNGVPLFLKKGPQGGASNKRKKPKKYKRPKPPKTNRFILFK